MDFDKYFTNPSLDINSNHLFRETERNIDYRAGNQTLFVEGIIQ
jgi:hypothetical protein